MNVNQVIERIKEIKDFDVNKSEISRIVGIKRQNMGRYNDSDLPQHYIDKIEDRFKICLSTGEDIKTDSSDNYVNLPVRGDITASLGSGLFVLSEEQTASFQVSPQLIKYLGANTDTTDIIFSQGNSMMPTIQNGDALMIDRSKREIIDGKIYVVRLEGQLLAKRLQKIPPSTVMVISDNEDFKPYPIDLKSSIDFEICGQVLWYSRIAR